MRRDIPLLYPLMLRRFIMSMFYLLLLLPIGYLLICTLLYFKQDRMVFIPTKGKEADLDKRATEWAFEPWTNAQGERIGWQSREGDPQNVLLVFSGNGGQALNRVHYREFTENAGNWKTYLLEYPGYGARPGASSEATLKAAAAEAIDTLASVPGRTIWLLGESLGSGVASAALAQRSDKIAGLILVTPYDSLVAVASSHYSWLPVKQLLRTRFDSVQNLSGYRGPVAFIVGKYDDVIPPKHSQALYDSYGSKKHLWESPMHDHNVSGFLSEKWTEIADWLRENR